MSAVPAAAASPVSCPWCPTFDPRDPRHAGISHGLCAACAARLEAQALRRSAAPSETRYAELLERLGGADRRAV